MEALLCDLPDRGNFASAPRGRALVAGSVRGARARARESLCVASFGGRRGRCTRWPTRVAMAGAAAPPRDVTAWRPGVEPRGEACAAPRREKPNVCPRKTSLQLRLSLSSRGGSARALQQGTLAAGRHMLTVSPGPPIPFCTPPASLPAGRTCAVRVRPRHVAAGRAAHWHRPDQHPHPHAQHEARQSNRQRGKGGRGEVRKGKGGLASFGFAPRNEAPLPSVTD